MTVAYLQLHRAYAFGDAQRLSGVERGWLSGVDLAEVAAAGALVATDEEGGFAVFPALEDVGAAGLLAHGVQPLVLHELLDLLVLRPGAEPGLDPGWLALDRGLSVARFQPKQFAAFWCDGHAATTDRGVAVREGAARERATRP